jgi:hypothetical protein
MKKILGEGAKGFFVRGPYPYEKLPQTPAPNPLRGKKKKAG